MLININGNYCHWYYPYVYNKYRCTIDQELVDAAA